MAEQYNLGQIYGMCRDSCISYGVDEHKVTFNHFTYYVRQLFRKYGYKGGNGSGQIEVSGVGAGGAVVQIWIATALTTAGAVPAVVGDEINDLEQVAVNLSDGDTVTVTGTDHFGNDVSVVFTYGVGNDGTKVSNLITVINSASGYKSTDYQGSTCTLNSAGKLLLTDNTTGISYTTISLAFVDEDAGGSIFTVPTFSESQEGLDDTSSGALVEYHIPGIVGIVTAYVGKTPIQVEAADVFDSLVATASVGSGSYLMCIDNNDTLKFYGLSGSDTAKIRFTFAATELNEDATNFSVLDIDYEIIDYFCRWKIKHANGKEFGEDMREFNNLFNDKVSLERDQRETNVIPVPPYLKL